MTLVALITAFALTVWAVGQVISYLTLDLPNDRSSHALPTPRGGGLGVVPVVLLVWVLFEGVAAWPLLVGALILMLTSLVDDRRGLSPATRLIVQIGVVTLFMATLPVGGGVVGLLLALGLGFMLLWFVNLYNFMDGIDGISGIETASLGFGIALIALLTRTNGDLMVPALALAGAALGFLVWNWHPAKVFLGDSGSVPLGYLCGGLLLLLALNGHALAALILPAYYLTDASITLGQRIIRREKIWQAHRKHFYQRATRAGAGPIRVCLAVGLGNLCLILSASMAAVGLYNEALTSAALIVATLLAILAYWGRNAPP